MAWRRYNWRVVWLSLLYALFLLGAVYGLRHKLDADCVAYVVAILPALPIIGIFAIGRHLVEEQDETVRMLMVRQTLWASGFALSAATIWGVGHVDGYYVVIAWFFGLGLGGIVNKLALGESGC